MSQNRLGIAAVILIALVGVTVWKLNARKAADQPPAQAGVTLPKIDKDKIDELVINAAERPKAHLVKKDGAWRLTEPVAAEADTEAVSSALTKLGELEITGVAATLEKNHDKLEVTDKKGTHVVAMAEGKPVVDLWIGSYQGGNSMLRLEGQPTVATVRGSIRYAFSKQTREWRDREITEVPSDNVKRIIFQNPKGRFEFTKDGEEWKQVLAKGEKAIDPLDANKVKGIVGTASSLDATDFAEPDVTAEQAGVGDSGTATLTLEVGGDAGAQQIVYHIGVVKDQNYYLKREGVDQIYLVSSWIGGRLISGNEELIKRDPPPMPAGGADPHGGMMPGGMMPGGMPPGGMQGMQGLPPEVLQQLQAQQNAPGSPSNPIQVLPKKIEKVEKPGGSAKPGAAKPAKPAAAPK